MTTGQELTIRGVPDTVNVCEIHDWETDGLALRLVQAMHDRYPKEISVCVDCIQRAVSDRDKQREQS